MRVLRISPRQGTVWWLLFADITLARPVVDEGFAETAGFVQRPAETPAQLQVTPTFLPQPFVFISTRVFVGN